jgi:hypothetical protein
VATLTQSEFDHAKLRGSQEDYKRILNAIDADGTLTVVPDPDSPTDPAPQLDEAGEEVKDSEGNVVLQAPEQLPVGDAVVIEVENVEEEEAEEDE